MGPALRGFFMRLSDLHQLHSQSASARLLVEALEFCLPFAEAVALDRERVAACEKLLEAAKQTRRQPSTLLELLSD